LEVLAQFPQEFLGQVQTAEMAVEELGLESVTAVAAAVVATSAVVVVVLARVRRIMVAVVVRPTSAA
jgi:hypothetical protein